MYIFTINLHNYLKRKVLLIYYFFTWSSWFTTLLVSSVQQDDSVTHNYIYILFLRFFFIIDYYKALNKDTVIIIKPSTDEKFQASKGEMTSLYHKLAVCVLCVFLGPTPYCCHAETLSGNPQDQNYLPSSVQSLSDDRLFATPWTSSTPGFTVHHQLPESTQIHVHWISDAIQPSYPLSSPSPPALNLSKHQGLFKWISSFHQVAKVLEFQLQHQSFQWTPRTDLL